MQVARALNTFFYRREKHGNVGILIAKIVDDFLIVGTSQPTSSFIYYMNEQFKLGKAGKKRHIKCLGCDIFHNHERDIEMRMDDYRNRVISIPVSVNHEVSPSEKASSSKEEKIKIQAGTLSYCGAAVILQTCMVSSNLP